MRSVLFAVPLCLALTLPAVSQTSAPAPITNAPAPSPFGFSLPEALGTLTYSLSGSESFITGGGYGGADYTTALSGNLAYLSNSEEHSFSAVYSGGYFFSNVPNDESAPGLYQTGSSSNFYQSLALSQVFHTRHWVFLASDAVSYLPQSPTVGLSGVAGVGDLGIVPVQNGLEPDESILTNYGNRVANGLSGSASWQATARASVSGSASWETLRFITGNGIDSNAYTATLGPSYRIDARNTVSATGSYSYTSYIHYDETLETSGASLSLEHIWSRRFSSSIGFGPQFTHGSGIIPIPSQVTLGGSVSLNYNGERTTAALGYQRGTNAGSGVIFGAVTDSVNAGASRPLSRNWIVAVNADYSRSRSLAQLPSFAVNTHSIAAGAQASRRIGRRFSAYLSYTAIDQSVTNLASTQNAYVGLNHVVAVGLTFSPAPIHQGR